MRRKERQVKPGSVTNDARVKRAIQGLAEEIEKTSSHAAEDKLFVLISTLESKVKDAVDSRIKETSVKWAWRVGGTGTGFLAAYGLLFILGWSELRSPSAFIKRIYTPTEIFQDVQADVQKVVPKALQDPDITTKADLQLIATSIRSANDESLRAIFENPQQNVTGKFVEDFSKDRSTKMNLSSLRDIDYKNESSCGIRADPSKPQAIILRPAASNAYFPPWLNCGTDFPRIILKVAPSSAHNQAEAIVVDLIGVNTPQLNEDTSRCLNDLSTSRPLICDHAELQLTRVAEDQLAALGNAGRSVVVSVERAR